MNEKSWSFLGLKVLLELELQRTWGLRGMQPAWNSKRQEGSSVCTGDKRNLLLLLPSNLLPHSYGTGKRQVNWQKSLMPPKWCGIHHIHSHSKGQSRLHDHAQSKWAGRYDLLMVKGDWINLKNSTIYHHRMVQFWPIGKNRIFGVRKTWVWILVSAPY